MRRPVLLTLVLAIAVLLGAGGAVLAYALSGHPATSSNSASGSASSNPTAPATAVVTGGSATGTSSSSGTGSSTGTTSSPSQTASASASASSSPATLPVLTVGGYSGMRPTEIAYSGDGTNVVTGLSWGSWTGTSATGTGTSDIDNCVPSCAAASPNNVPTTVTLSNPVNGKFTQMTETRNGTTTTYTYPSNWAQSAS